MSTTNATERTATLVLEVELPTFYAEDLRSDNPDWQRWLKDTDTDPTDAAAVGQEILHNVGEVSSGLLTIRIVGEKDGSTVRTPVLMVGARVEDRPPTPEEKYQHVTGDLGREIDEPIEEQRVLAKMDHAELVVLGRFVRQLKSEYTGQVSQLAEAALQEARLAADEAEKRESERGLLG